MYSGGNCISDMRAYVKDMLIPKGIHVEKDSIIFSKKCIIKRIVDNFGYKYTLEERDIIFVTGFNIIIDAIFGSILINNREYLLPNKICENLNQLTKLLKYDKNNDTINDFTKYPDIPHQVKPISNWKNIWFKYSLSFCLKKEIFHLFKDEMGDFDDIYEAPRTVICGDGGIGGWGSAFYKKEQRFPSYISDIVLRCKNNGKSLSKELFFERKNIESSTPCVIVDLNNNMIRFGEIEQQVCNPKFDQLKIDINKYYKCLKVPLANNHSARKWILNKIVNEEPTILNKIKNLHPQLLKYIFKIANVQITKGFIKTWSKF